MADEKRMRYLEDFVPGSVIPCGKHTISQEEIIEFATQFDPQYFHTDPELAQDSHFGGLIASGWHVTAIMMRKLVDGYIRHSASMGSPGVDEVRWLKPVRPGDTLDVNVHVLEVVPSRSKPDRGIVKSRVDISNQHGEVVSTVAGMGMYGRMPAD